MNQRHEFALYVYGLSELLDALPAHGQLCIKSKEIHSRISRILRLKPQETLVLFDQRVHAQCKLHQIKNKEEVDLLVLRKQENSIYKPHITVGLPLLKRNALEQAVYGLVEVGASLIQLLTTEKSQQRWHGEQEYNRLERIVIAAAEQSKYYAFPNIVEPVPLFDFVDVQRTFEHNKTIFLDPSGMDVAKIVESIPTVTQQITLIIGPESDLSAQEKKNLSTTRVDFCSLTPTILRAQQAAVLGAGIFRSFFT